MIKLFGIALTLIYFAIGGYFLLLWKSKHSDPKIRKKRERSTKITSGIILSILSVFAYFMFFFRAGPVELTKEELIELTEEWKEPKVVQWHYVGSYDGFDFFHHRDLNTVMGYKVKEGEIEIEKRFPATHEEDNWMLMPWGPYNEN